MKNNYIQVILLILSLLAIWIYSLHSNYQTRNKNIIEFSLTCIDDDYNEVYEHKYFALNPFDYFLINRSKERIIWISKPKTFNSYSDYVVSVRELKDPSSNVIHFYDLKRKGDYFYFEAFGKEFDYSVKVHDAHNAKLNCSIIDYWIKDPY